MKTEHTTNLDLVREFHERFLCPIGDNPELPSNVLCFLRWKLLYEELEEFSEALEKRDLVGAADALADILYVAYGAALTFGLPINEIFAEVHRSNMTKLGEDGNPIFRPDGKILKGPNYTPPDIKRFIK